MTINDAQKEDEDTYTATVQLGMTDSRTLRSYHLEVTGKFKASNFDIDSWINLGNTLKLLGAILDLGWLRRLLKIGWFLVRS